MKYIINKTVIFDSTELTLCLYENTQIVARLTKPATRLLLALIQKSGISITREALLENVWLTYGFTASNAGLNNYISELRKAFSSLGYDHELIITLPKLGFRFEAEIDLHDSSIIIPESLSLVEENESLINIEKPEETSQLPPPIIEKISISRRKELFVLAGCILIFAMSGIMILNITKKEEYDYQKITKIDNCDIYVLGKTRQPGELSERIANVLKQEAVDCKNIPSSVFYFEDRIGKNTVRADLTSVCSKDEGDHYDTCFNIKSQRNTLK